MIVVVNGNQVGAYPPDLFYDEYPQATGEMIADQDEPAIADEVQE